MTVAPLGCAGSRASRGGAAGGAVRSRGPGAGRVRSLRSGRRLLARAGSGPARSILAQRRAVAPAREQRAASGRRPLEGSRRKPHSV